MCRGTGRRSSDSGTPSLRRCSAVSGCVTTSHSMMDFSSVSLAAVQYSRSAAGRARMSFHVRGLEMAPVLLSVIVSISASVTLSPKNSL